MTYQTQSDNEYRITRMSDGHYVLYINGEFYASGDTWREMVEEIEKYESEL